VTGPTGALSMVSVGVIRRELRLTRICFFFAEEERSLRVEPEEGPAVSGVEGGEEAILVGRRGEV
jgi:hypothetical protein